MTKKQTLLFLFSFPSLLVFTSFFLQPPREIISGMWRIILSPSLLLTDYIAVGGLGATLLNAGLCGLVSSFLIARHRVNVNGPFIAAVYTVIGFAFFGKNIFNIWPILGGVYLCSLYQGVPYRNNLLVALFGTTLAPLVSFFAFASGMTAAGGLATGILLGLAAGFILPNISSHMLRFHDGYNIYNVGFTGGIIGSFIVANVRSLGFEVLPAEVLAGSHDLFFKIFFSFIFLAFVLGSIFMPGPGASGLIESLKKINRSTGRLVSDFVSIGGYRATFLNMGLMGFASIAFLLMMGGSFNGPAIGGILTVVGFAAFGKHLRNCLPVLFGVAAASTIKIWEISTTAVVIAGLFGTTLAPIAGQYGALAGIAAGFFHLSIVMNVGFLHGGINLYNNGFAGGFVASFLVPVIDSLKRHGAKDD